MQREHVARQHKGLWNGIWTDMYIETTFMGYGKVSRGLMGLTATQKLVKKWAYGLKTCVGIVLDL